MLHIEGDGTSSSSIPLALTLPGNSKNDGEYSIGWTMSVSSHVAILIMNTLLDLFTTYLLSA